MVKIGMMIGERYEILEKIGTGGMSDVYKAKCHKLNRFVAVKVLKQEFSENANFVSKFRIEAQAAAGLMHPNIVNVYDVGEENGIYYIVMELVEGITLKKYIEKKARLSYKEAVSIAIQVSMGIEAAHKNHIIHRDIKPQNIIISKDGKVKVTDFGIAKAATSNTITSNVMGSVHYTSPEQARGGYSDEKSDIYSMGITLFEMLTGRVPFNGETTVAIAIKHIQEEIPSPKEYVAEIPNSVEGIVLKCCQKSPDRRYLNVQELIQDLKRSLLNPDENFVVQADPDMEGGTQVITDREREQIKQQIAYVDDREELEMRNSMRLRDDTAAMYENEEEYLEGDDDYDYDPKMEKITTILAIVAGIVICIIILVLAVHIFGELNIEEKTPNSPIITSEESTETAEKVAMPDVVGIHVDDVRKTLSAVGLLAELEYEESDSYDAGVVIAANVNRGTEVEVGSTVVITVSAGVKGIEVPAVVEISFEDANSQLVSAGFLVNKVEDYSDSVERGKVISQNPSAGNKAPRGSVITITVSKGKEDTKVQVPKLIGKLEEEGTILAIESGLEIGSVSYVYSENAEIEEGQICYQSSSHGSYVEKGTPIDIKVSLGVSTKTFKCNANIVAPSAEEAPDYVAGSEVTITLVTDNGQILLETTTSTFPQSANYYGLTSASGTVTMTYSVTTQATTGVDPNTGAEITIPGGTEQKSITRRIEFVQED